MLRPGQQREEKVAKIVFYVIFVGSIPKDRTLQIPGAWITVGQGGYKIKLVF